MAENENPNKYQPPRRGFRHPRPPPMNPGVRKAVHNFGVRDLREILDKKHQDGEVPTQHKENEPRSRGLNPPPDPSYNFLKDSSRDQGRPAAAGRRNDTTYSRPGQYDNFRKGKESPVSHSSGGDNDHGGPKKDLRFTDSPRIGRGSFRGGRNTIRKKEEKIENPVNIKVELSFETGQRNCVLDENTKIPDIKHVPDKYRPRGGYRGRGSFRGRGRGRGHFVARKSGNSEVGLEEQKPDKKPEGPPEIKNDENVNESKKDDEVDQEYQEEHDEETEETYEGDEEEDNGGNSPNVDNETNASANVEGASSTKDAGSVFDSNLKESITITSSKFQDGEIKREVQVEPVEE